MQRPAQISAMTAPAMLVSVHPTPLPDSGSRRFRPRPLLDHIPGRVVGNFLAELLKNTSRHSSEAAIRYAGCRSTEPTFVAAD
jgi:hypothetical protein